MAQNEKHKITLSSTPIFTIKIAYSARKATYTRILNTLPGKNQKSNKVHALNSTARQESKTVYTVNCPVSLQAAKKKKYAANL